MERQIIDRLSLIAEASGKTFDRTYSSALNGNMMTFVPEEKQIKFTHFSDLDGGKALANTIMEALASFGYSSGYISRRTKDSIFEYVISY